MRQAHVRDGLTTSQNDAAPKPRGLGGRGEGRLTTSQNDAAPKRVVDVLHALPV